MSENNTVNISIRADASQAIASVEAAKSEFSDLSQEISSMRENLDSPVPAFGRGMAEQLDIAESGLVRLLRLKQKAENAPTEQERTRASKSFDLERARLGQTLGDLRSSLGLSTNLFGELGDTLSQQFASGIQQFMPRLMSEFKSAAMRIAKSTGTTDDASLLRTFQQSDAYRSTFGQLRKQNPDALLKSM